MNEDLAKRRFFAMQGLRWAGMVVALLGILAVNGKGPLPQVVGYVFTPVGLVMALVLPGVLARRWRSRDQ